MREPDSYSDTLEKEIIELISHIELHYMVLFDSIKSKKDKDGVLYGFKVNFVDEDSYVVNNNVFNDRLTYLYNKVESSAMRAEGARVMLAALNINPKKWNDVSASDVLGVQIYELISDFESEHSVLFKSIKNKKAKDGKLVGITVSFEDD